MNVMTETPVATGPTTEPVDENAAEDTRSVEAVEQVGVAIPGQQDGTAADADDATDAAEPAEAGDTIEQAVADMPEAAEAAAESGDGKTEDKLEDKIEDKSKSKRPKKSAPRKAAGTKTLVVLRDGRVQFADVDTVLVIDLDEAALPDTDVHDVVDRLAELRDAVDSEGKADAVKALTDIIQEKALG
jgi:hypothetical protein